MLSERNPKKKKRLFESKEKNEKRVPTETEYLTIENVGKISLIRQWKKGTTRIVDDSMLAGIEQKHISGNGSVKICIFPGATTHNMYGYRKPLLKKESRQHYLAYWNQ